MSVTVAGPVNAVRDSADLGEAIRSLRAELARAPRLQRARVRWAALGLLISLLVILIDALTGSPGLEPWRLAGVGSALVGMFALTLAAAFHTIGSGETATRLPAASRQFHRLLDRIPLLTTAAAVLFALAAGLLLPSMTVHPGFALFSIAFAVLAVVAARDTIRTGRVLYAEAHARERAAERARAEASQAQLRALQSQLQPHFLFNALNTVASLVRTDPRRAERTVEHLADVLRRTLARAGQPLTTLRDEVDYVTAYLAVEQERWGDELRVEWRLAPETLDVIIPSMTLQPLVENALKHGVGRRLEGGRVYIASARTADGVELSVSDDGPGFDSAANGGTGLANLRARLETLSLGRGRVEVGEGASGWGAIVRVTLPADLGR
ncbi:MAG TPA: histidine kinase [Gemmatimonadaceae bacterium]|nr:histidine kinase [Gemmatimonadaceae bacterium]